MSQTLREIHRKQILTVVKGKEWKTFAEIERKTGLSIKEVMNVTSHEPYDIISSRHGYKRVDKCSASDIELGIGMLRSKRKAILDKIRGFQLWQRLV